MFYLNQGFGQLAIEFAFMLCIYQYNLIRLFIDLLNFFNRFNLLIDDQNRFQTIYLVLSFDTIIADTRNGDKSALQPFKVFNGTTYFSQWL